MDPGNYAFQRHSRHCSVPPDRAFDAWTDAGQIKQWLDVCGCDVSRVDLDLRIGEAFNVIVPNATGHVRYSGRFQKIDLHRRLVFSLADMRNPQQASRVTVDFEWTGSPDCCQITVGTTTPLPDERSSNYLPTYWDTLLDGLVRMFDTPG